MSLESEILKRNGAARIRAQAHGEELYQMTQCDTWPACVECGAPLRNDTEWKGPGLRRKCQCAGFFWRLSYDIHGGWHKVSTVEKVEEPEI